MDNGYGNSRGLRVAVPALEAMFCILLVKNIQRTYQVLLQKRFAPRKIYPLCSSVSLFQGSGPTRTSPAVQRPLVISELRTISIAVHFQNTVQRLHFSIGIDILYFFYFCTLILQGVGKSFDERFGDGE